MESMRRLSLHTKIMLVVSGALLLVFLVAGLFALQGERRILEAEARRRAYNMLSSLHTMVKHAYYSEQFEFLSVFLDRIVTEDRNIHRIVIFDRYGTPAFSSGVREGAGKAENLLVLRKRVMLGTIPVAEILLEYELGAYGKTFRRLTVVFLLALFDALVFIAFFLHIALKHFVSGPLDSFLQMAEEVARGNLDVEVAVRSGDEIGLLASKFN